VWRCAAALLLFLATLGPAAAQSVDDSSLEFVSSQQFIVIDADTGEIFAAKDPDGRAGMASVTKIFTAIIAIERVPLDFEITAQESDLFDSTSTTMPGFVPGNVYTVEDLLYGMMLQSGNDAAEALARGIAQQEGDSPAQAIARFMGWINDKALELGMTNTHLSNPHGLSAPDHYSTPRDIAAWMMYAIQNPVFMELASATQFTVSTGDVMYSINRAPQFIPNHVAGKTGFDNDTGYCLAELQQRGDLRLITVTLDGIAPDIWYQDHAILADFGFAALQARLDSGEPISGDVIALAPETVDESGDDEVAQAEPTTTPDVREPSDEVALGPVPIDATPAPVAQQDDAGGISGNWFIPIVILGVIVASLLIRSGWRPPARAPKRSPDEPD
jgi:D-alanyl-D-alanine carboxypeptidase (penicillin-binding protein 5/6)